MRYRITVRGPAIELRGAIAGQENLIAFARAIEPVLDAVVIASELPREGATFNAWGVDESWPLVSPPRSNGASPAEASAPPP